MSVSETVELTAPAATRARSGLAPLAAVLAIGLAVLVLLLSIPTGGSAAHHHASTQTPHLAR
jgi:hypothetical protein